MKKIILCFTTMTLLYACREQGGHGGNDEMYENVNEKHETIDDRDTTKPKDTVTVNPDTLHMKQ